MAEEHGWLPGPIQDVPPPQGPNLSADPGVDGLRQQAESACPAAMPAQSPMLQSPGPAEPSPEAATPPGSGSNTCQHVSLKQQPGQGSQTLPTSQRTVDSWRQAPSSPRSPVTHGVSQQVTMPAEPAQDTQGTPRSNQDVAEKLVPADPDGADACDKGAPRAEGREGTPRAQLPDPLHEAGPASWKVMMMYCLLAT